MMQKIQLTASKVVSQVVLKGRNLNQVLDGALSSNPNWQPSDRGAIQDLSYGTIRHYGQLKAILNQLLHKTLSDDAVNILILVALYQLQYGKATQHTIVDQAVRAVRSIQPRMSGLVNAILRSFIRQQAQLLDTVANQTEARWNHPEWWVAELNSQYGKEKAEEILEAGNLHPPMTLRVNHRYKANPEYLQLLLAQGIDADLVDPGAIQLKRPVHVDRLPGFSKGWVSVQDAGAQHAAILLDAKTGMRVLDACSAPGGKTAHILEQEDVEMLALDKDAKRLDRVTENLQRLQLKAKVRTGDASDPSAWWNREQFDRILADVPCSASGVVKRHPDIKWLRRREDIENFSTQQFEILESLWPLLKPQGKLLYATCSVFKQENNQVIDRFMARHSEAQRLPIQLPNQSTGQLLTNQQHDGFFYALLQKGV